MDVMKEVDRVASLLESKYNIDSMLEAVGPEFQEKFKRQQNRFNNAIESNDPEQIKIQGEAMIRGWQMLDKKYNGCWEITHSSGTRMLIFKDKEPETMRGAVVQMSLRDLVAFVPAKALKLAEILEPATIQNVRTIHTKETELEKLLKIPMKKDENGNITNAKELGLDDEIPF